MSSKKIAKQIKNEILSCDPSYDYVYDSLSEDLEHTLSGILNSILYLFRNIDNINNYSLLDNVTNLLNNYVKGNKNSNKLDIMYDKIQVFLDNIGRSFDYLELLKLEKYISSLVDIQNKCLMNPLKKVKNDKYYFMHYLIFKKRDIEFLSRYLLDNMKELLVNMNTLNSVFASVIEHFINIDEFSVYEINYFSQVIYLFLRGKLGDKLLCDNNDFIHILKSSNKEFVWNLINEIENDMITSKEELASKYNVSILFPSDMEIIEYDNFGMADFTEQECITIDGEDDMCLDDALYVKENSDGSYRLYIHIANPTSTIPYDSNVIKEALKRCKTIYLPGEDNDISIFEDYLSHDLLSILPGKKTNTLTFMMDVDTDYSILLDTVKVIPSTIISRHKLSYDEVDKILDNPGNDKLSKNLLLISKICNRLSRENLRIRAFHKLENIIKNKNYTDSFKADTSSSHRIVEQSMVFVNRLPYILSRYHNIDIIMPWRVQPLCDDDYVSAILSDIDNVDTNNSKFIKMARNYLMKSKYSIDNIGHSGLGVKGYSRIGSGARRAMDDLALYAFIDLYVNRSKVDLNERYYFWENEIKYWCEYANNKSSENDLFVEEFSYRYNKGKILERK